MRQYKAQDRYQPTTGRQSRDGTHVVDPLGELSTILLLDVLDVRLVLLHHRVGVEVSNEDCSERGGLVGVVSSVGAWGLPDESASGGVQSARCPPCVSQGTAPDTPTGSTPHLHSTPSEPQYPPLLAQLIQHISSVLPHHACTSARHPSRPTRTTPHSIPSHPLYSPPLPSLSLSPLPSPPLIQLHPTKSNPVTHQRGKQSRT